MGAEVVLDLCDYLAYCLDDPETHAVMLFVEGFKRPERFLALADRALELGKPILAVKVGRSRPGAGRGDRAQRQPRGRGPGDDAALDAAGVIRCDDLDELLEAAELVAGVGRLGRRLRGGRTGVVTVSTGEASLVADLADADRHRPAAGHGRRARGDPARPADDGLHRQPARPVGRGRGGAIAYRASFEALAASGAYDVLAIVHDYPFRELPSEVDVATDGEPRARSTRRPAGPRSCRCTCR